MTRTATGYPRRRWRDIYLYQSIYKVAREIAIRRYGRPHLGEVPFDPRVDSLVLYAQPPDEYSSLPYPRAYDETIIALSPVFLKNVRHLILSLDYGDFRDASGDSSGSVQVYSPADGFYPSLVALVRAPFPAMTHLTIDAPPLDDCMMYYHEFKNKQHPFWDEDAYFRFFSSHGTWELRRLLGYRPGHEQLCALHRLALMEALHDAATEGAASRSTAVMWTTCSMGEQPRLQKAFEVNLCVGMEPL
ncbi:hypothetical protein B0T22DRAFT_532646 [Podospora appendiculata]|uniref:Uncharacterized protein n=1 Tax=Podospora appendiculata TaxID=314037 RepID=A0AAE1CGK3_9PEZI|nr:hypothetical protein B0T22DRAFT_532646 [Podospora appendiculata]